MNTKAKKYSVTVGVPAYNEEKNILNTLRSVLSQKGDLFELQKIIVMNDNSTDATEIIVRDFIRDKRIIELVSDGNRRGHKERLQQLYDLNTSDILITFDADLVLSGLNVIEELVRIFSNDPKAMLVTAHEEPLKPHGFMPLVIYYHHILWNEIRLSVKSNDHIQNLYGGASALRKSFADSIIIPKQLTSAQGHLYISAKKRDGFRYAKKALVYYRPVATLADFRKQGTRAAISNQKKLAELYGQWVYAIYKIPAKYKIRGTVRLFLKHPVYTLFALLLGVWLRLFPKKDKLYDKGLWKPLSSSKDAIVGWNSSDKFPAHISDKTLTVGIPTYVGGPSLVRAAESIRASTGVENFRLIVAVDGNPLRPEIESALQNLDVEIVLAGVRGGQVARLKQIIYMCRTELVILTQDDIIFEPDAISKLVNAFAKNPKLTMANANVMPMHAETIIEKVQHSGTRIGKYIAMRWNGGDNYLSANGRCQAFRVKWAKKLEIPEEVINSDAFAYFRNKKLGGSYRYIQDAVVYDKSPLFIAEYVKQNKKFQYSANELARYFGEEIRREYSPTAVLRAKAIFMEGAHHPILFAMYMTLRIYMAFLPNTFQKAKRFWDTDISTKR